VRAAGLRVIPGARVHLMPGDGHLSMTVSAFDQILETCSTWPASARHRDVHPRLA
jgi:hypothetical protein